MLASAAPSDDVTLKYYRVRRMLGQYDKLSTRNRAQVERLVSDLRNARPKWGEAVALAGRLADLKNNPRQAADDYQLAVALGNRSPWVLERLVAALYSSGKYEAAETYLTRLPAQLQSSPQMESLAIESALRRDDAAQAIELARQAVEAHPEDPVRQIWLANLLASKALADKTSPDEAETVIHTTLEKFPKDARVWNALFMVLHRSQQLDKARRALDDMAAELGKDSWEQCFVAARAYQLLGDATRAIEEADAACRIRPEDLNGRLLLAKLLMSTDVSRSRTEFARILEQDSSNGEARRNLAILLSASGNVEDQQQAMKLLEGGGWRLTRLSPRRTFDFARRSCPSRAELLRNELRISSWHARLSRSWSQSRGMSWRTSTACCSSNSWSKRPG